MARLTVGAVHVRSGTMRYFELQAWGCATTMHVAHLNAPRLDSEDVSKDINFTSNGVRARREAGYADAQSMLERAPWTQPVDPMEGIVEHSLD